MDTNGPRISFFKESREKRVEGSAWLARSGAPARQLRRALPEVEMNHERADNRTTNGHEWTTNIFFKESREERVEGSAWLARSGALARQFRRALPV